MSVDKKTSKDAMKMFFQKVLPSEGVYFLAQQTASGVFHHYPFSEFDGLVDKAHQLNSSQRCVYFACASYATPSFVNASGRTVGRVKDNATFAKAFWLDIDCGDAKFESGKGYRNKEDANAELDKFCHYHGLPLPMTVSSGGGLHCYWPLTENISKEDWLIVAAALKELTKSPLHPLLADQSRTSDIASILRPVGTSNWKRNKDDGSQVAYFGATVEVLRDAPAIEFQAFKSAIEKAIGVSRSHRRPNSPLNALLHKASTQCQSLSLDELADALQHVDPDVGYNEWFKVLSGVAEEFGEVARDISRRWSSGELLGQVVERYDEVAFERQYDEVMQRRGIVANPITIATVIKLAKNGGWTGGLEPQVKRLNQQYAWIEKEASIYRIKHGDFIAADKFKLDLANQKIEVATDKGVKTVPVSQLWLSSQQRRQHRKLVFKPGLAEVTPENDLNTWSGFKVDAVPAKQADCLPFVELLRRLFPERMALQFVVSWLAHLIQNPDVKMNTALVLWSRKQGVGKNLLVECIKDIIGDRHAALVGQAEFNRDFNGWLKEKLLIIGDEVSDLDRRIGADKLKGLITGRTVQINEKFQPVVELENQANFIFLSNHNDALFVDDHDRRFFVWEIKADKLPDATAKAFVQWRDDGGLAKLRGFLESLTLKKFDPKASAPMTDAKRAMIKDSGSDLETYIRDLINSPASTVFGREIVTASEIADRYSNDRSLKTAVSLKAVSQACQKMGAFSHPNQVRLSNGKRVRLLAIEQPDYWENQPPSAWAAEFEKNRASALQAVV